MKHITEVLETTFSNWEAPRPVSQLLQVQAKFLQRPLFVAPVCAQAVPSLRGADCAQEEAAA